jgi:alpha-1,3-mannosyltransferase
MPPIAPSSKPLKILHIVRQFHPGRGGLEDFVANLAREQLRDGHNVRILTCNRIFSRPDQILPDASESDGLAIRRIGYFGSNRYPAAPQFIRHLGNADIVHVHAIDFFFDALAVTRPFHRKPLVATTHGGFFHTSDHARLKRFWFEGPTRWSCKAYGAIVGCSQSDTTQFSVIAGDKVRTIENGVDLKKFAGSASPSSQKTIVTVGRFSKNKRLDRLIAAVAELVRSDAEWRLYIAGLPSDFDQSDIQAQIEAADLTSNVTLHVNLSDDGLRALFNRASFFASASEYEGFGIALIEAMSAGLRCVVHPNASFAALARRHPGIRLVDFSNASDAATVLRASYRNWDSYEQPNLSEHAWPSVAAHYESVYRELV